MVNNLHIRLDQLRNSSVTIHILDTGVKPYVQIETIRRFSLIMHTLSHYDC